MQAGRTCKLVDVVCGSKVMRLISRNLKPSEKLLYLEQ
jgi:hypothetical protein